VTPTVKLNDLPPGVVRVAFEWQRGSTIEEITRDMGIAEKTVYGRLRHFERLTGIALPRRSRRGRKRRH